MMEEIGARYAQIDSDLALKWIRKYQPRLGHGRVMARITANRFAYQPSEALQLLADIDDASEREIAVAGFFHETMISRSSELAKALVAGKLPNATPSMVSNLATIVSAWTPSKAKEWALKLPDTAHRDAALVALISEWAGAKELGVLVSNVSPEARPQALRRAVRMLRVRDPESAQRLIDQFSTAEKQKRRLLRQLQSDRL